VLVNEKREKIKEVRGGGRPKGGQSAHALARRKQTTITQTRCKRSSHKIGDVRIRGGSQGLALYRRRLEKRNG